MLPSRRKSYKGDVLGFSVNSVVEGSVTYFTTPVDTCMVQSFFPSDRVPDSLIIKFRVLLGVYHSRKG